MATQYQRRRTREALRTEHVREDLTVTMAVSRTRGEENTLLAQALVRHRYAVCAAMLQRSVRRPEMNVGLELVALSFVEHFAGALARDDWGALLAWTEKTCLRYGGMTAVPRLLRSGPSAVAAFVAGFALGGGNRGPEFALVAERIDSIVSRPRASPEHEAADTLDEIDVVLGELVERLEAADPGTAEHSRAVSLWCARIGKRMALSATETNFVTRCGLIHDIGKMTTPPEILQAPRRLSLPETNVMRKHAEDGDAIVSAVPLLIAHKPAVRWHHERLDGRGYPDGLTAAKIPLAARIVSVADSFNAMIGNRPYRLPMRPSAALEELWRHAGTQFDPDVLGAMNDVLSKRPLE